MAALEPLPPEPFDADARATAEGVLRQAFVASRLGMPTEDMDTAVHTLWITLESMLVDHLSPTPAAARTRDAVGLAAHWRRLVTTAVTHAFALSGRFLGPEECLAAVVDRAERSAAGRLWHTRRPPGQGALVLGVHRALLVLDATVDSGARPGPGDADAVLEVVALGTLGVVLEVAAAADREQGARRRVDAVAEAASVADAFGIAGVRLVPARREGWACDECGCVFAGRVEGGIAYPDRLAPVGRRGPCDLTTACACHAAPLQREVRGAGR
jgi:hypothetical protein